MTSFTVIHVRSDNYTDLSITAGLFNSVIGRMPMATDVYVTLPEYDSLLIAALKLLTS
jgi:hypothetical protein